MATDQYIERRIITGMIASDEYIKQIAHVFKPELLQASAAQTLGSWCNRHYHKYNKAPGRDIETIFGSYQRRGKIDKESAADIEDILEDLSGEYEEHGSNVAVLVDETLEYFEERNLLALADEIKNETLRGNIDEAQAQLAGYKPTEKFTTENTDFFADDPERTRKVFENVPEPIIKYPGKLGTLLNRHLVRGGFVSFLGPEKIGKTWTLMNIGFQAQRNGMKVAFFAAGDMNREEMELRKYIYMARRSNDKEYCGELLVPVVDCWRNQNGDCEDAPGLAPFDGQTQKPKDWKKEFYLEAFETFPDHVSCKKCMEKPGFIGAPWFKLREACEPLDWKTAYKKELRHMKRMRGVTWQFHEASNGTLTNRKIHNQLAIWHNQGFDADVVLVDYPDIMGIDDEFSRMDFRHRENSKWAGLRGIAHDYHALMIAVTQADEKANRQKWIDLSNFSEDKRKYAHATAFFGLNQTDDEAHLGIFRINQLLVRSGKRGFKAANVLQRLEMGRPFLGSF